MGLSFFVGEIQAQTTEAIMLANEYIEHANALNDSINSFLYAPLSSKAYDSAKNYFEVVYQPITNALILAAESLITAHTDFLEKFHEIVGEGDIEEDRLHYQIQQGHHLLRSYSEVLDKLDESNQPLEQGYFRTQEAIRKLEERLESLYLFDSVSTVIFSEAEADLDNLERGLAFLDTDAAWKPSSGTFDIAALDLTWTQPVHDAWRQRQKRVDATILAETLSKKSKGYRVEATLDESGKPSYFVYKKGLLNSKLTSELAQLLAEFQLAKYQGVMNNDASLEQANPSIISAPLTIGDAQVMVNSSVSLGEDLAIGFGKNVETGEPVQLLIRIKQAEVSEALTTVSVGISELLTGVTISE